MSPVPSLGDPMRDLGLGAQLACIWEATARKAGNVHRYQDFDDTSYPDFLLSAAAIAPILATASQRSIGATVLACVRATRAVVRTNTNLGIILLLAPLAAVPPDEPLRDGVAARLDALTLRDAEQVYEAIRLAAPGGLGQVREQDVHLPPTQSLRAIMALAADRDAIARQYTNHFADIWNDGVPALLRGLELTQSLEGALLFVQLTLLAHYPDTLIARKCGLAEAAEATRRAADVLATGWPREPSGWSAFTDFDAWLRAARRQRNPGTTADLLAACLFIALREDTIRVPLVYPWPAGFPS